MKTILLPVQLCEQVLKRKIVRPFQLYLLLKSLCSGKMRIHKSEYPALAEILGRKSGRTISNNLKTLIQMNFIGNNPKSGYYFIRGISYLSEAFKIESTTATEFDYAHIRDLQAFCLASVVSYIIRRQKIKGWGPGRKEWRPKQSSCPTSSSNKYMVSNTLIAQKLKISLHSAYTWKKKAHDLGFIEVTSNLIPLKVHLKHKKALLKGQPELRGRLRAKNHWLYIQGSDFVAQKSIVFKRRKKIKTLSSGGKGEFL
ncbi:MAG: hypothetical protein V4615_05775 [Bacteroidota bacterium]